MVGAHGPIGSIGTGDTEPKPTEILNLNDEEKMWIKLDGPNQMNGLYGIGRATVDNDIFIFGRFQRCSKRAESSSAKSIALRTLRHCWHLVHDLF